MAKSWIRTLLISLIFSSALTTQLNVQAQNAEAVRKAPPKPAHPQLNLPDAKSEGQRAIDLLGTRLPEVAAHYRKSPDQLKSLLLNDSTYKIDRKGRLFVEEPRRPAPPAAKALAVSPKAIALPAGMANSANSAIDGTLASSNDTFLLHSRRGAKRTIYLNFVGAVLTGTAWNNFSNNPTIIAPPFDIEGIPGNFTSAEHERIQYIWQRVAEDYAPFDVDVTTEPPPADRITRSSLADDVYGTSVLITHSASFNICASCAGQSFISVFDDVNNDGLKTSLVFYDKFYYDEKAIAEAVSHEVGHQVGLGHDGTGPYDSYYLGHGSGLTGWAPIMGGGYYQNLTQWSKGEYLNANNVQDDYLVMQDNGLPLRTDDHGNEAVSATALSPTTIPTTTTTLYVEGVIERPTDVDVFSFNANPGVATFDLRGAARSSNLDAQIDIRDIAGNLLGSANPVDELNASLSVNLPNRGTYFVYVKGVGKGDPLVDGYTNYGSLGQYALSGIVPTVVGQPPGALLSVFPFQGPAPLTSAFSGSGSYDSDGTIVSYKWVFGDGTTSTAADPIHTYTTPGSYTAGLLVTDNSGLSSTRSVPIVVTPPIGIQPMYVGDIILATDTQRERSTAFAAVMITNATTGSGVPVASVTGKWSGIAPTKPVTVRTDSSGYAYFTSPTTEKRGAFIFTVTEVSLPGYAYQSKLNIKTSDSIRTLPRKD